MSEAIERVVAAIAALVSADDDVSVPEIARAAIEALRVPAIDVSRPTMKAGQAAIDIIVPTIKAHWNSGGSASMNPSLDYLDVKAGAAAINAMIDAALS